MKKGSTVEGIEIVDIGAKGKVIGKKDGQTFMTSGAIPGDVVSIQIKKSKKNYKEGRLQEIQSFSKERVDPACEHFEHCGGCSWQNMNYPKQIELKERGVLQQMRRIGGIEDLNHLPILGSAETFHYRNKMEFTFVSERYLTPEELSSPDIKKTPALGFHVPGRFDWVLHINNCHLQNDVHNTLRNFIYEEALSAGISFYHPRNQVGIMRNVVLRNNRQGQWMVLMIIKERTDKTDVLYQKMADRFPEIQSLWIIVNSKVNDSFSDCPAELFHGDPHIIERFNRPNNQGSVDYIIGPKSFFQTNSNQAEKLYEIVYNWAGIQPTDTVYDLYSGAGTIALFVAKLAKKVVGVEYVPEAIGDAFKNAQLNGISNCSFYAGDMKDVLTTAFFEENGKPDVLISDPPRAGMHSDVIDRILEAEPKRIVYVSCDPSTQARDIALMKHKYKVVQIQPVDMFPHTSHVENVALLELMEVED